MDRQHILDLSFRCHAVVFRIYFRSQNINKFFPVAFDLDNLRFGSHLIERNWNLPGDNIAESFLFSHRQVNRHVSSLMDITCVRGKPETDFGGLSDKQVFHFAVDPVSISRSREEINVRIL